MNKLSSCIDRLTAPFRKCGDIPEQANIDYDVDLICVLKANHPAYHEEKFGASWCYDANGKEIVSLGDTVSCPCSIDNDYVGECAGWHG